MEIERKYLMKKLPEDLESYPHKEIEQGYLCRRPVLRIRKSVKYPGAGTEHDPARFIFTYKDKVKNPAAPADGSDAAGKGAKAANGGLIVNDEIERELSEEAYMTLRGKTEDHLVEKTRYLIPLGEFSFHREAGAGSSYKLILELDVFHGRLQGLVFGEVEFPDETEAAYFEEPDWFGENVSADRRYSNAHLAMLDSLQDL